ncbi:MAG: THUMP domain-containing protein [Candidatus Verstraetearchaeota archaeon]|nr:THUMP domain-containing protein [Candidatus Verstraetearchaeota archaeon]
METSLDPDDAALLAVDPNSSLVMGAVPVDLLVPSDLIAIENASVLLAGRGPRVAVRCRRRGSLLPSAREVERRVGHALVDHGCKVDLDRPELIVRIEIIGETTAVSVRPPTRSILKK